MFAHFNKPLHLFLVVFVAAYKEMSEEIRGSSRLAEYCMVCEIKVIIFNEPHGYPL